MFFPGVSKFVYISVHDYNLPEFALNNGYFAGKRKAEAEILSAFPNTGLLHSALLLPHFPDHKLETNLSP